MADAEKTEKPTPKKIRDARKKGQVAKSQDVASTAILFALFAYFFAAWGWNIRHLKEMIALPALAYGQDFPSAFNTLVPAMTQKVILLSFPPVLIAAIFGIVGNYIQVGPILSGQPIKPELKKVNPAEGFKKLFSMKSLFELLKSTLKVLFLGALIYVVVRNAIDPLVKLPYAGVAGIMEILAALMIRLAVFTLVAYMILAVADYAFQKYQHTKQLKMTKDEVKREYKEMEGNPEIKGKRKQLHRELLNDDSVQRTKNSSVVVTNPTHRAIGIYFEAGVTRRPIVLAKGADALAARMVAVAKGEGIPIMENVPLARALYDEAECHAYVPTEFHNAVFEVLEWLDLVSAKKEGF